MLDPICFMLWRQPFGRIGACKELVTSMGFIDTKGKYVINPQFDDAESFSEGLALRKNWRQVEVGVH